MATNGAAESAVQSALRADGPFAESDRRVRGWSRGIWLILVLAAALRFWGLGFGLPNTVARPDEGRVIKTAAGFTLRHTLDPQFFAYPTLLPYVVGGLYAAGCAGAVALGAFGTMDACSAAWCQDWGRLVLTARAVSALAGVAGVAAVFAIGWRLHRSAGAFAAALLAVAFLHVRDSHFAVTDVAMTSMVLLALLLLLRADEHPSAARFLLAGFVAGLATSTKYSGALLGAAAVVSQIRAWFGARAPQRVRHVRLLLFGAAAVVGFFAGTPYALLSWPDFQRDTAFESWHLLHGHAGLRPDIGWRYHALVTLPQGVGWPLFATGVAGVVWTLATRAHPAATIFAFPLVYYVVAGRGYTVFARYMIPVVPFLCLGAGALIASMGAALARRHRMLGHAAGLGLLALCVVPTGLKAVNFDRILSRTDSRVLAANWIVDHVTPGASILDLTYGLMLWRGCAPLPYDVWTPLDSGRIVGASQQRPDWIVVEESPLRRYSVVPEELRPVLREYALKHTIRALNPTKSYVYDQQDAFYVPLSGFAHVVRPGPNLYLYERRR